MFIFAVMSISKVFGFCHALVSKMNMIPPTLRHTKRSEKQAQKSRERKKSMRVETVSSTERTEELYVQLK